MNQTTENLPGAETAPRGTKGGDLRKERAYARFRGDGAEVARLTREIERLDATETAPQLSPEARAQFAAAELEAARRHLMAAQRHLDDGKECHVKIGGAVLDVDDVRSKLAGGAR